MYSMCFGCQMVYFHISLVLSLDNPLIPWFDLVNGVFQTQMFSLLSEQTLSVLPISDRMTRSNLKNIFFIRSKISLHKITLHSLRNKITLLLWSLSENVFHTQGMWIICFPNIFVSLSWFFSILMKKKSQFERLFSNGTNQNLCHHT